MLLSIKSKEQAYIKDNEKYDIHAVQDDKDPEQPPSSRCGKEEGKTASRVIKKESKFLPHSTSVCCYLG